MNIYEKLLAVQCELKAPKSQFNKFGGYNFRNCEDILEAAKPICRKYNAVVYLTDSISNVGDRYYVTATATFVDVEKPETPPIIVQAHAREEESKKGMDGSQVTGASSSYARKYALNGLFDIDDTKDSDTTNHGDTTPQNKPNNTTKPTQKKPAVKSGLSEETKNRINLQILQVKKATGLSTKDVLASVEQDLGFSVEGVTDESEAVTVLDYLNQLTEQAV